MARSKFHKTMFHSEFSEGNLTTDSMVINGFSSTAFHAFVQYLYQDDFNIPLHVIDCKEETISFLSEVLCLADQYCMARLFSLAEHKIVQNMECAHVLECFSFAERLRAEQLLAHCAHLCLCHETEMLHKMETTNVSMMLRLSHVAGAKYLEKMCKGYNANS